MSALDTFAARVRAFFAPGDRLRPSRWVEKNLYLPPGHESKPGPISFDETPYLRGPIDDIDDPSVRDIVLVSATRVGKTLGLRAAALYGIAGDPAPALWVNDTVDNARAVSETEIQPVVNFNACLRDRKPADRHKFGNLKMLFPGAALYLTGANSPGNVAGKTVARVWGNEVDKWLGATAEEAAIIDLVRHRTGSFEGERKHFFSSTPTTESGQIWVWYLKGDQRKWHVTCACGESHVLHWDNVKWDQNARDEEGNWIVERAAASARYVCPSCSKSHTQAELDRMKKDGFWRATAKPLQAGVRSYWLTGLAGPWRENSMSEIVAAFMNSRRTGWIADRQDFWNSRMGLPFVDTVSTLSADKLSHLCAGYSRGCLPDGWKPDVTLLTYDVQTWGLPWLVRAYKWSGESYLIDHGIAASWADLESFQDAYSCSHVCGDMNYESRRAEQLDATYRRAHKNWGCIEGFEVAKAPVALESANAYVGGKLQAADFKVPKLVVSLYQFKCELEKKLEGKELKNWHVYTPADDKQRKEQAEYFSQMLDERRRPRKHRTAGKPEYEFVSKSGNNHAWDCEVYNLALFFFLQHRHTSEAQRRAEAAKAATARAAKVEMRIS